MHIHQNYDIQSHNTLACPSVAQYYCVASTTDELQQALRFAQKQCIPVWVLGGGSNVLAQPKIKGVVIQPKLFGRQIVSQSKHTTLVAFNAGENWHKSVEWAVENHLHGIENLALIPGDIGAAPIQNIGAYGVELKDVFDHLTALNVHTQEARIFNAAQCEFGYRDSIFKQSEQGNYIITQVVLRLSQVASAKLTYPALATQFNSGATPSLKCIMQAVVSLRNAKLPHPDKVPNTGSFFKNPVVNQPHLHRLKLTHPEIVFYPDSNGNYKIPAAWLIDALGFKGRSLEGIVVHENQALVLTNPRHYNVDCVLHAANIIQAAVEQTFNIMLEIEPRLFG